MNCDDARFALAAEPRSGDPGLLDHLEHCPRCAAYSADMHELDDRLRVALEVPVPARELPSGPYAVAGTPAPGGGGLAGHPITRRFALAASVAGVAVLAGLLWAGFPRQSLAGAVVAHMAHEPQAWQATAPVPAADLDRVTARSGVRLRDGLPDVTYAHSCWFRGRQVPHLVVTTPDGPVTVLVIPGETVERRVDFDEAGYRGTLVAAPRGSIAVLTRDKTIPDPLVSRVLAALDYGD